MAADDRERTVITAVAEADIQNVVPDLTAVCRICQQNVTVQNFGGFVMVDSQPSFFCDRLECVERASDHSESSIG
jgi:RNA polymerase subunit RPABC4/transcription elongation factor Spt4